MSISEGSIDSGASSQDLSSYQAPEGASSDVNILRERTFNPELRKLVDQIRLHESEPDKKTSSRTLKTSENEVLVKLHRLFYRLKNIDPSGETELSFKPLLKVQSWANTAHAALLYLQKKFKNIGLTEFAILDYSIKDEAYRARFSTIKGAGSEHFIIPLHSALFREIKRHPQGLIIRSESLKEHLLFRNEKPNENEEESLFWFQDIAPLSSKMRAGNRTGESQSKRTLLSSILVLKIEQSVSEELSLTETLPELIRNEWSVPLSITNKPLKQKDLYWQDNQFTGILTILKLCYRINDQDPEKGLLFLNLKLGHDTKRLLMLQYIKDRVKSFLHPDSLFITLNPWRFVILSHRDTLLEVNRTIADDSAFSAASLVIEEIFPETHTSFEDFFTYLYG